MHNYTFTSIQRGGKQEKKNNNNLSVSLTDDYWKGDDDYWDADSTPSRPQPDTAATDPPYDYWKPEKEDPAAPVTDAYDYWKPEEKQQSTQSPEIYEDYWKPYEKEPFGPVTENYDSYWKEVDLTPATPEVDGKAGTDDSDYWDAKGMSQTFAPNTFVLRGDDDSLKHRMSVN